MVRVAAWFPWASLAISMKVKEMSVPPLAVHTP
jgi:hypothetical protein